MLRFDYIKGSMLKERMQCLWSILDSTFPLRYEYKFHWFRKLFTLNVCKNQHYNKRPSKNYIYIEFWPLDLFHLSDLCSKNAQIYAFQ